MLFLNEFIYTILDDKFILIRFVQNHAVIQNDTNALEYALQSNLFGGLCAVLDGNKSFALYNNNNNNNYKNTNEHAY